LILILKTVAGNDNPKKKFNKKEILLLGRGAGLIKEKKKIEEKNIVFPVLYFGGSYYDYKVASKYFFDFVFVSNWTEMENWESWVNNNNINNISQI
jgi:hypothetical protein